MAVKDLLSSQWADYTRVHTVRGNLLLHIGAVPLFLFGNVAVVAGLLRLKPVLGLIGAAAMGAGLALQAQGHKLEAERPAPFTGPGNAFARLFLEQWVTFPRFVLSGGWLRAVRRAA